ncbi:DUF397 domain-containing protein [Streptomyces sp. NPDC004647]|uniref:DUF397 domain-containing protein n=1 Tax=Streptomyces sp. NPDC004647 TaxID=3154671 RepID=UPI00339E112E
MHQFKNGTPATHIDGAVWKKSTYSNPSGNCLELARLPGGDIALRNSRDPGGPALICTRDEIAMFLFGAKDGEFDGMIVEN